MLETVLKTDPPMSVEDVMDQCDGQPVLNLHESITVPDDKAGGSGMREVQIITQKGLIRQAGTGEVIGITVCFAQQNDAQYWIDQLGLAQIDLGGYFAGVASAGEGALKFALPDRFNGDRRHYSTNYYLLKDPQVLQLHSLNQDEQWFYHAGNPIRLHCFTPDGRYLALEVGSDPSRGQTLQAVAPHGSWFGGEILEGGYGLFSCSLAPGWAAADPARPSAQQVAQLKARFPAQVDVLNRLSGPAL